MVGWRDGWVDGWLDGWMGGWMAGRINVRMDTLPDLTLIILCFHPQTTLMTCS